MDILPPLVARRVKRLKSLHMERERVMEKYLEEIAALEMKYLDLCKPLYKKIGNVVAGRLGDEIDRVNKEGGGEKEEEGSNGDNSGIKKNTGEGEEREGAASLEGESNNNKIYGVIASGQGTTTTTTKDNAKGDDDEEGCMVGIPKFWVYAMGHMEAVSQSITERDIECLDNLNEVTC